MPKRGERATPAQRAAAEKNLAKGRAAKLKKHAEADPDEPSARERWAMLLSGQITMRDLDDEEIRRRKVRGKGGMFYNSPAIPSHIAVKFEQESIRRAQDLIRSVAKKSVQGILKIAEDPEVDNKTRLQAYKTLMEHAVGKAAETVKITGEGGWEAAVRDALDLDRDLADLAREAEREDVPE